jgi:hypothetical protein
MFDTLDKFEKRLAASSPVMSSAERDRLLVAAAVASAKKSFYRQAIAYSILSSLSSVAACIGLMTLSMQPLANEGNVVQSQPKMGNQSVRPNELGSASDEVLTVASWSRWKPFEQAEALSPIPKPSEVRSIESALETEVLSVRSRSFSY